MELVHLAPDCWLVKERLLMGMIAPCDVLYHIDALLQCVQVLLLQVTAAALS